MAIRGGALPFKNYGIVSPHEQQMLLGTRGCVTISSKGEKHAHCASICAEKRKPGKQQILDILKALVHEQQ